MTGLLFLILTGVLVCGGITVASLPEGILHKRAERLRDAVSRGMFPGWLAKPLLLCETCMATIWGNLTWFPLSFLPFVGWGWVERLSLFVPMWLGIAVCNHFLWVVISTLKSLRDDPRRDPTQHHRSSIR